MWRRHFKRLLTALTKKEKNCKMALFIEYHAIMRLSLSIYLMFSLAIILFSPSTDGKLYYFQMNHFAGSLSATPCCSLSLSNSFPGSLARHVTRIFDLLKDTLKRGSGGNNPQTSSNMQKVLRQIGYVDYVPGPAVEALGWM